MWVAIEIGINIFQAYLLLFFINHRLHLKSNYRLQYIVCLIGMAAFLSVYYFTDPGIPDILVFLVPFIYGLISAKDPWYVCAFWASVLALVFTTVISVTYNLFLNIPGITYDRLMDKTPERLALIIVPNTIEAILIWLTKFIRKDYSVRYWPMLIAFLMTIIGLFATEESVYSLQNELELQHGVRSIPFFWSSVSILMCEFFTIILFHNMSKSMENENRYRMEIAAIEKSKAYSSELEMMYDRLNEMKHDLKHHYQAIGNMIIQGREEEAKAYLEQSEMEMEKAQYRWTGSSAIDALILAKSMKMAQHDIMFRFDPYPMHTLPISETEFCAILGNILDNAIEGVCCLKDNSVSRIIQLNFSRAKDMLYLYCKNPCDENSLRKGSTGWISSKKADSHSIHGLGIRSVQRIVTTAEGRCEFKAGSGFFTVKVVLPLREGVKKS